MKSELKKIKTKQNRLHVNLTQMRKKGTRTYGRNAIRQKGPIFSIFCEDKICQIYRRDPAEGTYDAPQTLFILHSLKYPLN